MNVLMSSPSTYLGKRRYDCDEEQDANQLSSDEHFRAGDPSKFRRIEGVISNSNGIISDSHKYYESQLLSLRVEYQINLEKKEKEINSYKALLKSYSENMERVGRENVLLAEENGCLKKAVQILDKKQKESSLQIDQLASIAKKASEYIEELEKQNRNLVFHLSMLEKERYNFEQPPPDIY